MGFLVRYPVSLAIVLAAVAATAGVFVFARPQYRPEHGGVTITLPDRRPAADLSGSQGWVWPDGTPGWEPGYTVKDFNVSGLQPVEVQAAQLAAARNVLDASEVRVLVSLRTDRSGVLGILAAPTLYRTPVETCLAALFPGDAPVRWQCELADARVFLAAETTERGSLWLAGVARGDVYRVLLTRRGQEPQPLYERGKTWGQFEGSADGPATLEVYGRRGVVETIPLQLRPGGQRVYSTRAPSGVSDPGSIR
jgi:hypothetical protein